MATDEERFGEAWRAAIGGGNVAFVTAFPDYSAMTFEKFARDEGRDLAGRGGGSRAISFRDDPGSITVINVHSENLASRARGHRFTHVIYDPDSAISNTVRDLFRQFTVTTGATESFDPAANAAAVFRARMRQLRKAPSLSSPPAVCAWCRSPDCDEIGGPACRERGLVDYRVR